MSSSTWQRIACAAVLCMLMLLSNACGSMTFGVGIDDDGYDSFWDGTYYLHDGLWQGKYVWYDDSWHYLGYGTPYLYDPWRDDDTWDYYN